MNLIYRQQKLILVFNLHPHSNILAFPISVTLNGTEFGTEGLEAKLTCVAKGYPVTSQILWSVNTDQKDKYQITSSKTVSSNTEVLPFAFAFTFTLPSSHCSWERSSISRTSILFLFLILWIFFFYFLPILWSTLLRALAGLCPLTTALYRC